MFVPYMQPKKEKQASNKMGFRKWEVMLKLGFEPFKTPDADDAADMAKEFCLTRGLTPKDVKIVRRDGYVRVVVIREGAKCKV